MQICSADVDDDGHVLADSNASCTPWLAYACSKIANVLFTAAPGSALLLLHKTGPLCCCSTRRVRSFLGLRRSVHCSPYCRVPRHA